MEGTIRKVVLSIILIGVFKAHVTFADGEIKTLRFSIYHAIQSGVYECKPSRNFTFVPGLQSPLSVQRPTLFKVSFQGSAWQSGEVNFYLQILVNNRLIIGDRLVPNTPDIDKDEDISASGGYFYTNSLESSHVIASKFAFVYVAPGIYKFDIGVRTTDKSATIRHGILIVERTEYDDNPKIGLPLYDQDGNMPRNSH